MNDLSRYGPPETSLAAPRDKDSLADVLERVLDKGLVIAGDVRINLLDIELLTIKVRLLIASADKAREMGIDWWTRDPHLSSHAASLEDKTGPEYELEREKENKALRQRVERLESQLSAMLEQASATAAPARAKGDRGHGPARR